MSARPSRITDQLWLAAHDGWNGKPVISERALGVGLAAGLFAELIHRDLLQLNEGELFRTKKSLPDDLALEPLLTRMEEEEDDRPAPPPPPVSAARWVPDGRDWPSTAPSGYPWPEATTPQHGRYPVAGHASRTPPTQVVHRHGMRAYSLRKWMSFWAGAQRAEDLVIARLARDGLVEEKRHRRLLGGLAVRWVPYDSVVAGAPATAINTTLLRGEHLQNSELMLAGLILATGLYRHTLATLEPGHRDWLTDQLKHRLDPMSRELLKAADTAVADAAAIR